ncbi:armadillo-type protein [Powellomyces hirtus]|nr:armadillo-type protein [Powellomyces hirtus]
MANPAGPYVIASLLEKMSHHDSDYRWMATNDLMAALQSDAFHLEDVNEKKVVTALIKLLTDSNGEVQNVAVKCFAPLVKKIHESQLQEVVDQLCRLLVDKREELRDIAGIGLKTVVIEIPSGSPIASTVVEGLVPKLLQQFTVNGKDPQLDVIDILSEVLSRFAQPLAQGAKGPKLQKAIKDTMFPLLNHSRAAARKRATGAIGHLVTHLPDDLFNDLVKDLLAELKKRSGSTDYDKLRTYIGCLATLSRYSSHRFGQYLDAALPLVFENIESNDDELRENCLHALDAFVLRCPTEMTPYVPKVIELSLTYITHDPNFQYEEDEEAMDVTGDEGADADEEEEEDDEYEEDYSDEDDVSWKVRKASSKLLASIIGTRTDVLRDLLLNVAPVLISRFKEREESVRVDILTTFAVLVKQTGAAAGLQKVGERTSDTPEAKRRKGSVGLPDSEDVGPRELLRQWVPQLSIALAKELKGKSIPSRQAGFSLLRELVRVLNGGLDAQIGLFIPAIEVSLSNMNAGLPTKPSTNSNLKIEILEFLGILFRTHQPECFHKFLARLVPPIMSAAEDKFYKITSEALSVTVELVKVIRPISYDRETNRHTVTPLASPEFEKYLQAIYNTTFDRLKAGDVDLEVKEHSIIALGSLISQTADLLPSHQVSNTVLPLLVERLKNELTRLTTVRVLKSIADSPLFENPSTANAIDLAPILPETIAELISYLRKSHRQLRVASLKCLETLIRRYGKQIAPDTYPAILSEMKPLLSDSDLHILPLAMAVICIVVYNGPNAQVLPIIKSEVQPQIVRMILESPHLVGSGPGLEALLQVWQCVVRTGDAELFSRSVDILVQSVKASTGGVTAQKQAFSIVAQSLATICLNAQGDNSATVGKFIQEIESDGTSESMRYVSLLTLGDIGRNMDLSVEYPSVDQTALKLFESPSEEIKQAAAFALGNIALGNLKHFMPVVLANVREGGKKRYLVLVSLKEIITRFSHHEASAESTAILESFAPELWQLLFQNTEETAEETTRNAIAECLGKLSLSQPDKFLPDLQSRLASPNAHARATVVTAIRYTFTEHTQHESFDALLRPIIVDFLRLVKDGDLNVRRVALTTFNSAAHNKPHLILESLPELLPLLYDEAVVKMELIHIVEMGPFKHQVDDGLDARKAAFECMYTLLETCLSRIDIFGFLQRVLNGLRDPSNDIKILSHLMLQRLSYLSPTAVAQKLDEMVEPLKLTLLAKSKSNAVKQEVEKTNELVRSTARTTIVLANLSEISVSPRFVDFLKEVHGPQSSVAEILATEQQNGLLNGAMHGGGVAPMDLS